MSIAYPFASLQPLLLQARAQLYPHSTSCSLLHHKGNAGTLTALRSGRALQYLSCRLGSDKVPLMCETPGRAAAWQGVAPGGRLINVCSSP